MILFAGLSVVCVVGTLLLLLLRRANRPDEWFVPQRAARAPTPVDSQREYEYERSYRSSSSTVKPGVAPDAQTSRQTAAASGRASL